MRYATLVITIANERASTERIRQIRKGDEILAIYEEVYDVSLLENGTAVSLCRFEGDAERIAGLATEAPGMLTCSVTRGREDLVYMHYEPVADQRRLLELLVTQEVTVEWPMTFSDRGLRVTLIGEDAVLSNVVAAIPDELNVTVERTGTYQPGSRSLLAQLTERQREIAKTALSEGYYEIPRRASQRDIAAKLDVTHGTIAEHLRKTEAKVMRSLFE
ncbi:helix-turn-helix domain-containing protein [Halosolutus gelatinilyticus]|uniref:helix-turn-helix domain-containing protein n=1 Tax=Halosolutus gelatinilyticus TaxID=2931975 RepID=UPI001FF48D59|nr:helix-turn-helix domain-containing protein [Halosolutus gelatinilyticus]